VLVSALPPKTLLAEVREDRIRFHPSSFRLHPSEVTSVFLLPDAIRYPHHHPRFLSASRISSPESRITHLASRIPYLTCAAD
jgi:hypothetical protein